jgi:Phage portal protein, SPP1 Gp6-like
VALSVPEIRELLKDELWPAYHLEKQRLDKIDCWYRWKHPHQQLPRTATREHKALLDLSVTPWLQLVVTTTAQCLFVDGYRSTLDPVVDPDDIIKPPAMPGAPPPPPVKDKVSPPEGPWKIWLANGMDRRQAAIYRAALAYGYSYVTVLPGEDPLTGDDMPTLTGISPRKMWAVYEDPAIDDWPTYAMQVLKHTDTEARVRIFDETHAYDVAMPFGAKSGNAEPKLTIEKSVAHGIGVTPVVRYCNELDLDGRTPGEVEPHISLAQRINKTSYDRALVQHFNSWKIRYIAGLQAPDSEAKANRQKLKLAQDDFLIFEDPDTKAGSLPETMLQGFIQAHENDIQALAAVTQTPTHELTGQMVNLSAEALAAARASQMQKVSERQMSFGAAHVQALRLASHIDGDTTHAEDITGRVTWQDTSIRSLSQAADAWGKVAQMLHVPDQALWPLLPGITKQDVAEWVRMARQIDPVQQMVDNFGSQLAGGPPNPGQPAAPKPGQPKGVNGSDPAARARATGTA